MRFPYLQVAQELFDVYAPSMAGQLDRTEAAAAWFILKLWKFSITLGPKNAPPDGIIRGEASWRTIERAVGWDGQPGVFAQACIDLELVEKLTDGHRIRGTDRYHPTWAKNSRRKPTGGKPGGNRPVPAREPEPQTQTHTQIQIEDGEATTLRAAGPPVLAVVPAPVADGLQEAWNSHPPLPRCLKLTPDRQKRAKEALKRRPLEEWREVFARIAASDFLLGGGETGWRADFDWAIRAGGKKPEPAQCVLEGKYDNRARAGPRPRVDISRLDHSQVGDIDITHLVDDDSEPPREAAYAH